MGTRITVTLWQGQDNEGKANLAFNAIFDEMDRIDQTYSPYIETSELYRLNKLAAIAPQPITAEMYLLLNKAQWISQNTDGAFDITFASVGHLYNYRESKQPTAKQREQQRPAIDYRWIELAKETVYFKHPNVVIDLGGIAKGYAADRAIAIMRQFGISHGSVSAGGDSRLLGDRRGRPWLVGIKNPRDKDKIAISLPLADTAVSTSGDYERFFIDPKSGERIHHIINPRSGQSARGIASVTVLGDVGLNADPLSTSVFVMGVTKGLELINRLPKIDAIIIDTAGKVYYSQNLQP